MSENVFIGDLNKANVLAALFNGARPQGAGFVQYKEGSMSAEQAQAILDSGRTSFEYIEGRVLHVDLSDESFNPYGYDRDNGPGAAKAIVEELRSSGEINSHAAQQMHQAGRKEAAEDIGGRLNERTHTAEDGTIHLGLEGVSERIEEAIKPYLEK